MDGFEATLKIKHLINNENFIDSIIISYSCNIGIEFEEKYS